MLIFKCDEQVRHEVMSTYKFFKCDYGSFGSKLDEYNWYTELQEPFDVGYTKFTCCSTSQIE